MSEEQFLARWSRRKQEAKADRAEPAPEKAAEVRGSMPSDRTATEPVPPVTDLSSLPPIDSIDAATDITAFLRKGVPHELGRAALRRAWSADPAIRDFVGLAENAWDFNDPNAMAGFGPLDYSAEQVDALVRSIVGGVVEAAERLANPSTEAAQEVARSAPAEAGFAQSSHSAKAITEVRGESAAAGLSSNSVASQPKATGMGRETSVPRRTHGGALPR
jgi:hypothetical protein